MLGLIARRIVLGIMALFSLRLRFVATEMLSGDIATAVLHMADSVINGHVGRNQTYSRDRHQADTSRGGAVNLFLKMARA